MSDTAAEVLKVALLLLGGGGGWKILQMVSAAWKNYRSRDERRADRANREDLAAIDITEQLRSLARDAVAEVRVEIRGVRDELDSERQKANRLAARVSQLEKVLHDNHIEVPAESL